jgi:hypothetical protein
MAESSHSRTSRSYRSLPRQPLPRRQPVRHPRQARHHTAKGYPARAPFASGLGCACLSGSRIVRQIPNLHFYWYRVWGKTRRVFAIRTLSAYLMISFCEAVAFGVPWRMGSFAGGHCLHTWDVSTTRSALHLLYTASSADKLDMEYHIFLLAD